MEFNGERENVTMKKEPWVVHCTWCDRTIVRGQDREIINGEHFCSDECWHNSLDERYDIEYY
jgi:hypothetical protein